MSWGSGWGYEPWGGGSFAEDAGFFIVNAFASGSNRFRVVFSEAPRFGSPLNPGDATNLANWTLALVTPVVPVSILQVAQVAGSPLELEFTRLGAWSNTALYRITGAPSLQSITLAPFIAPRFGDLFGLPATRTEDAGPPPLLDIRNPQTTPNQQNGGFVVQSAGDYELEGGASLLRKLITRRIITAVGEFYHLADAPWGLGVDVNELWRDIDLLTLKKTVEQQALREPEVVAALGHITLSAAGQLTIRVKAVTRSGQVVDVETVIGGTPG
jgi:hypothetical protein